MEQRQGEKGNRRTVREEEGERQRRREAQGKNERERGGRKEHHIHRTIY